MIIQDKTLSGERPLYGSRDLRLERVTIGEGESALKECSHIEAHDCVFEGRYIFWECENVECRNCRFASSDRAPLWYGKNIRMYDCIVDAPKVFRELDGLILENIQISDGAEAFWYCKNGHLSDLKMQRAEYAFMQSNKLQINNLILQGKYTFQYARNIEIHNAVLDTKDAFWHAKNVLVKKCRVNGEYLAWYGENITFENCIISGTQPLCYCKGLKLINCEMNGADLSFELSDVCATLTSHVISVKNPLSGYIKLPSVGEIILDNASSECEIFVTQHND